MSPAAVASPARGLVPIAPCGSRQSIYWADIKQLSEGGGGAHGEQVSQATVT